MSPAETYAREQGHTGLADVIRDICSRKAPSDFGRIPEIADMQKAELYLAHFGWHHACGHAPMPTSVEDMARLFDLITGARSLRWKDAIDWLAVEKHLATVPDLTDTEKLAIIFKQVAEDRRREEYEAQRETDRMVRERNMEAPV
jgi:hypothetical protein